jgi:hypothetical protein
MILDEGWHLKGDDEVFYKLGLTAGENSPKAHQPKAWLPMNHTDTALVTRCGIRTTHFTLASKLQRTKMGDCQACKGR